MLARTEIAYAAVAFDADEELWPIMTRQTTCWIAQSSEAFGSWWGLRLAASGSGVRGTTRPSCGYAASPNSHHPKGLTPFFRYVLAHELAIAELGRRVLTHDEDPLAPVEALLGNVPK
jgi:hypothetical protein